MGFGRYCHLFPEDHSPQALAALHAMAQRVGVPRYKFKHRSAWPHYRLQRTSRELALRHGAVTCTTEEYIQHMRQYGHAVGCLLSGQYVN